MSFTLSGYYSALHDSVTRGHPFRWRCRWPLLTTLGLTTTRYLTLSCKFAWQAPAATPAQRSPLGKAFGRTVSNSPLPLSAPAPMEEHRFQGQACVLSRCRNTTGRMGTLPITTLRWLEGARALFGGPRSNRAIDTGIFSPLLPAELSVQRMHGRGGRIRTCAALRLLLPKQVGYQTTGYTPMVMWWRL